ncbi:MAG: hypothetical protein K2Y18_00130 [Alphaproteobacteria bacterium]|jgi:hypothetical protein|nr:hypothetical protein [Alphaproteobacteria bacterium]
MQSKNTLIAFLSVVSISTAAQGEQWGKIRCLKECTDISCADTIKKETCEKNCAVENLEACRTAKVKTPQRAAPPTRTSVSEKPVSQVTVQPQPAPPASSESKSVELPRAPSQEIGEMVQQVGVQLPTGLVRLDLPSNTVLDEAFIDTYIRPKLEGRHKKLPIEILVQGKSIKGKALSVLPPSMTLIIAPQVRALPSLPVPKPLNVTQSKAIEATNAAHLAAAKTDLKNDGMEVAKYARCLSSLLETQVKLFPVNKYKKGLLPFSKKKTIAPFSQSEVLDKINNIKINANGGVTKINKILNQWPANDNTFKKVGELEQSVTEVVIETTSAALKDFRELNKEISDFSEGKEVLSPEKCSYTTKKLLEKAKAEMNRRGVEAINQCKCLASQLSEFLSIFPVAKSSESSLTQADVSGYISDLQRNANTELEKAKKVLDEWPAKKESIQDIRDLSVKFSMELRAMSSFCTQPYDLISVEINKILKGKKAGPDKNKCFTR